jgi:hypothetical protein
VRRKTNNRHIATIHILEDDGLNDLWKDNWIACNFDVETLYLLARNKVAMSITQNFSHPVTFNQNKFKKKLSNTQWNLGRPMICSEKNNLSVYSILH